jgi:hypothetical protein
MAFVFIDAGIKAVFVSRAYVETVVDAIAIAGKSISSFQKFLRQSFFFF